MNIRPYQPSDYEQLAALYHQSELYGGQFDENRDSKERLSKRIEADPDQKKMVKLLAPFRSLKMAVSLGCFDLP